MFVWVKRRSKIILLSITLIILVLIMVQIAIYSGLLEEGRKVSLGIESSGSMDSPQSSQYYLVTNITPKGTEMEWKDIRVMIKDQCTEYHRKNKLPCPKYEEMEKGKDYQVIDRNNDGLVSKGDTIQFNLLSTNAWEKDIGIKWAVTGDILYTERLPQA